MDAPQKSYTRNIYVSDALLAEVTVFAANIFDSYYSIPLDFIQNLIKDWESKVTADDLITCQSNSGQSIDGIITYKTSLKEITLFILGKPVIQDSKWSSLLTKAKSLTEFPSVCFPITDKLVFALCEVLSVPNKALIYKALTHLFEPSYFEESCYKILMSAKDIEVQKDLEINPYVIFEDNYHYLKETLSGDQTC